MYLPVKVRHYENSLSFKAKEKAAAFTINIINILDLGTPKMPSKEAQIKTT